MRILILWAGVTAALGAESNDIGTNDDPGRCVCDLTLSSCDPFCCCDSECSSVPSTQDQVSDWEDKDVTKNLCVAERFTPWGQRYCIKKSEIYTDNPRRGKKEVKVPDDDLFCVEVDNSPESGRFYQNVLAGDVSEKDVWKRVNDTTDYADTMGAQRNATKRPTFLTGDYLVSYLSDYAQSAGRWPIPGPDAHGYCSNMNTAQWFINQSPLPCSRNIARYSCNGPLDPVVFTTSLKISNSPEIKDYDDTVFVNVTLRTVTKRKSDGTVESLPNIERVAATGVGCVCNNVLLEAHYTVYSNPTQRYIRTIYADIVIADTTECIEILQQFSIQFYSAADGAKRSGNPGYRPGLPVLFKQLAKDTKLVQLGLGGVKTTGECVKNTEEATYQSSTVVQFRNEIAYACYLDMTLEEMRQICTGGANDLSPIFALYSYPKFVAKWGSSEPTNSEDFVPLEVNDTVPFRTWIAENNTCVIPHTFVIEFVYADVGFHSNPQSKILYAKAFFRENT